MKKIEYIIEYAGLPIGEHLFQFEVGNDFMQQYHEDKLENDFKITVNVTLIKYNHSLQANVAIDGTITVICDKCLIHYPYPINITGQLLVQQGKLEDSTDEIIMVLPNDNKINLSQYLYESISLEIPARAVPCEEFENAVCDEAVLKKINEYLSEQNKSTTFADLIKNKTTNLKK